MPPSSAQISAKRYGLSRSCGFKSTTAMTCHKIRIPCHSNNFSRVLPLLPSSPRPGRGDIGIPFMTEHSIFTYKRIIFNKLFLKYRIEIMRKIMFLADGEVLLSLKTHMKHPLPFHLRNSQFFSHFIGCFLIQHHMNSIILSMYCNQNLILLFPQLLSPYSHWVNSDEIYSLV